MRYAVFVDAGYLYAQGSKLLAGDRIQRDDVNLDLSAIINTLRAAAGRKAPNSGLLRIYWYDGLVRGRLSPQQESLAHREDIKLRLGIVTPGGRQKGVDSLIVTDLVELARNRAISDALVLSGDEDLRIGVLIAQSFGVRIHLIGIEPSRGSQSITLLQESDTTIEWTRNDVSQILRLRPRLDRKDTSPQTLEPAAPPANAADALGQAVDGFVSSLSADDLQMLVNISSSASIPGVFDGRLLATCRNSLQRELDYRERAEMRKKFREAVSRRLASA